MPFEPGKPKTGGRAKGTLNKVTAEIHSVFSKLMKQEEPHLMEALARVREEDPGKYYQLWLNTAEFVVPKLARAEIQADVTDPLTSALVNSMSKEELIILAKETVKNVKRDTES